MPNLFDVGILHFLNQFAQRSARFDHLVLFIQDEAPLSGAVVMGLFWFAWGRAAGAKLDTRVTLVCGLVASAFSILVARILALMLPFRERPLHNTFLNFQLPIGMSSRVLVGWSSFPSDHATFFFCLAAILWMTSRRLGLVAGLVAFFVVSLPRVYSGVHYPTDIIAGALLGCGVACASRLVSRKASVARPLMHWMDEHPASFYACLFLCTFEVGELFTLGQDIVHPFGHVILSTLRALR